MASIAKDSGGRKRILFIDRDGKRRTIRLGLATARQAQVFAAHVEELVTLSHGIGFSVSQPTGLWLSQLSDRMYRRVSATGLVKPRAATTRTLKELLEEFNDNLEVKAITKTNRQATRNLLLEFFGATALIQTIEPLQAAKWRRQMKTDGYAEATISKHIQLARQIFRQAVRWKLLNENPFADVKTGSQINRSRNRFIGRADAEKVMAFCPDAQWKLLFALSRYGGLRCPSEHLALRWQDIDWERGRMRVPCVKTAGHPGHAEREVPLFPELRPYLEAVRKQAAEDSPYVITRYRQANTNLRSQLLRIIDRAGLQPWPRLFHNLRASRQTELAENFPLHVVCAWIGNSEKIAMGHYLTVTDDHYQKATQA